MSSFGTSSPPPLLQVPPFITNSIEFLRHFILFFLLPIFTVILLAFVSAAIARYIYKKIFAKYATPKELLEDSLNQLKDNKSWSRDRSLDTLRLVIQLHPEKAFKGNDDMIMKPYIILANELFYGYIQDGNSKIERRRIKENNTTRLRRRGKTQQQCIDSPTLVECQDIIQQGLDINPQNDSLLKLQTEVQLIKQYGMNESHIKMLNAGYMGST